MPFSNDDEVMTSILPLTVLGSGEPEMLAVVLPLVRVQAAGKVRLISLREVLLSKAIVQL